MQAEGIQFALANEVGNTGSGDNVDDTNQNNHNVSPETNRVIKNLATKKEVAEGQLVPARLTPNKFKYYTKTENCSTSSGRHVKAATLHPDLNWSMQ